MCDEERREGKEELYLTSSRVDLTGDEEKKRGEEKEQEKKRRKREEFGFSRGHPPQELE